MDIIGIIADKFGLFLIVFARVSGIFSMSPFFGNRNIPARMKIGLALFIAVILLPVVIAKNPAVVVPRDLFPYIGLVAGEFIIGLIIGFASYLVFAAIQMAGALVDMQIGFSIVSVLDPQSGMQLPLLGTFKYLLALLLFLAINGHHVILAALSESFQRVPISSAIAHDAVVVQVTNMFAAAFVFAFKMALPVLVTLLLLDVAFGIMARTVPQMNVFIVGWPAKIVVGLLVLALVIPIYIIIVQIGFTGMYKDIYMLLDVLKEKI